MQIDLVHVPFDGHAAGGREAARHLEEAAGLSWDQLEESLTAAARGDGCVGLSVTIYDPEQDDDGSDARRITSLIGTVVDALADARHH